MDTRPLRLTADGLLLREWTSEDLTDMQKLFWGHRGGDLAGTQTRLPASAYTGAKQTANTAHRPENGGDSSERRHTCERPNRVSKLAG
ncbi:hypothetical protein EAO69_30145 [Streptomyces sp. me109]|nr:hypothetical protein EAO69_30145 [Streptomyces sp. me109]